MASALGDAAHRAASRLCPEDSLRQAMAARVAAALRSRALRRSLGATLVALCFLFLAWGVYANWHKLPQYDWHLDYRFLGVASVVYLGSFVFLVLGWHSIMRRIGGSTSIRDNTEIYCFSNILRRVPPSAWFVAGRIYLYKGKGVSGIVSSLGTFLEIVLIIVSGALVHLLFRPAAAGTVPPLTWVLAALPPLGVTGIYLAGNQGRRLWEKSAGRQMGDTTPSLGWLDIGRWVLLYSVAWLWGGAVLDSFVASLYRTADIRLVDSIGIWATAGVIGSLPFFVPAGLGVREATLSFLLGFYVPLPVAIVLSGLFRVFTMAAETLSSTLLLALLRLSRRTSVFRH